MNDTRKTVVVALLVAGALLPRISIAMEIAQFDRMAKEDQRHYLAFLVNEAAKLLTDQGERELALKVSQLFKNIPAGADQSLGETSFETELEAARVFSARVNMPGKVSWNQVDHALLATFYKNGIRPSPAFYKAFPEVTRNRAFYQAK